MQFGSSGFGGEPYKGSYGVNSRKLDIEDAVDSGLNSSSPYTLTGLQNQSNTYEDNEPWKNKVYIFWRIFLAFLLFTVSFFFIGHLSAPMLTDK